MKLWINKNSEISIREQLVTQISLGIASGDIAPGEKLPSTRELARRFGIHANTVSAAFRELVRQHDIERRPGSGVFAAIRSGNDHSNGGLEHMLQDFVAGAAREGFSRKQIGAAMEGWMSAGMLPTIALIEPNPDLRRILVEEIHEITGHCPIEAGADALQFSSLGPNVVIAAIGTERPEIAVAVAGRKAVHLRANSVPSSMKASDRPCEDELIAIVSCWEQFLELARIYLLSAQVATESLIVRNTGEKKWDAGLEAAALIICDSATAQRFPDDPRVRVFRLISQESVAELKLAML